MLAYYVTLKTVKLFLEELSFI